jgi:hypothetical protein
MQMSFSYRKLQAEFAPDAEIDLCHPTSRKGRVARAATFPGDGKEIVTSLSRFRRHYCDVISRLRLFGGVNS